MSYTIKCDDGDFIMDSAGRYVMASGQEKLAQDIAESLLNNYDPDFPTYYNGSQLYIVDQSPSLISTIGAEEFIRSTVEDAIDRLRNLQDEDDYLEESERIDHISELTVNKVGPMSYTFYLRVIAADESDVPIEPFTITLRQQLPASLDKEYGFFVPQGQDTNTKPYL